jgi:hypothetical protein
MCFGPASILEVLEPKRSNSLRAEGCWPGSTGPRRVRRIRSAIVPRGREEHCVGPPTGERRERYGESDRAIASLYLVRHASADNNRLMSSILL